MQTTSEISQKSHRFERIVFISLSIICLVIIILLSLSPIIDRDALIHHMAIPKIWMKKGILHVDKFKPFSFYPSNTELLYYLALHLNLEFLPKILHAGFLVLSSTLVFLYIRYVTKETIAALLGFIFLTTIPINQRLASEVYVDLSLLFFSTVAFLSFLMWKHSSFDHKRFFYISAIASGLAIGTKYNGLITLIMINFFVVFSYARARKNSWQAISYGGQFFIIAVLLASPWLIRNYVLSGGNPIFPLFPSFFSSDIHILQPVFMQQHGEIFFRLYSGESLLDILMLPLRLFFTGEDHNFLQFDGKLNPLMVLLLPLIFMTDTTSLPEKRPTQGQYEGENRQAKRLGLDEKYMLVFVFFVLFIVLNSSIRARYTIAAIPPLVILNTLVIQRLIRSSVKYKKHIGYACIVCYIGYNAFYTVELFNRLDISKYLAFQESKEAYLERKIGLYEMYEFINRGTPLDAVIYEVVSGQRSYYIDREYVHDYSITDAYFYNYAFENKPASAYLAYLSSIGLAEGKKATHLLIKPRFFAESFRRIFHHPDGSKNSENEKKLRTFFAFLKSQKLLFQTRDAFLYELIYPPKTHLK
ncbi:MAG: phospholipid carrier-dependent glycosyltransferase [bacterium]|nr:phospholipid carrier-dependent glycosyltransferase [bacterium]